MNYFHYNWTSM